MNFELTEDQKSIRKLVRDFAEKELAPVAAKNDREGIYPKDQIKQIAELGLMGVMVPPEWGGAGMDPVSYVIVIEELSRVCASTGVIVSVNNSLACEVIKNFGTEAQKKKYLIPLAKGEKLGAYCLTEPMSGSDAATQKTTAVKEGNHYIVNGAKNFITNGPQADTLILFCMTDASKGNKGISAFIIESGVPGFELGKDENKMGIRASHTSTISFTNMKVPAENLLLEEGKGFSIAMSILDGGRIGIGAQALGIAQAAYEEALKYAKERKAFGKSLSDLQGIRWKLSDMATEIDAARLVVYEAAYKKGKGGEMTKYASMAKLFASETASRVCNEALQIHGGYGYTKDYPVERFLRDARVCEIYEGTSEIQRLVIASNTLKEMAI